MYWEVVVWDEGGVGLIFATFSDPTNKSFGPSTFTIAQSLFLLYLLTV
jgi:hypothetical protein